MNTQVPSLGLQKIGAAVAACRSLFATCRPEFARSKPLCDSSPHRRLVVAAVQREAVDVVAVVLVDPEGEPLPAWLPGAHLDVFLPSGRQRQYSLCGNPRDRSAYRIAVRLMPHGAGGSIEIHENLRSGDVLRVHGPRHTYPFVDSSRYLFLAGGMGITALLPMARAAGRRGTLIYTGRSADTMPFFDLIPHAEVRPDDEFGSPDMAALLARAHPGAAVYVCGPPAMQEAAARTLPRVNPTCSLYLERRRPTRNRSSATENLTEA